METLGPTPRRATEDGVSRKLVPVLIACAACATSGDPSFGESPPPDGFKPSEDAAVPLPQAGEVFGHSDNALYRVDTNTRAVSEVGYFVGCSHVADIALDSRSNMYASTGSELFLIENNTGRCTRIASGSLPNSLSFVPAGTLGDGEVLVGYVGADYVRIDPKTGTTEKIGELGAGFSSSGDLVATKDGKAYLTVKGPDCADCLVEIDPKTGAMTTNLGSLGAADAFGLAYWGGELYAFTDAGEVLLVTLANGKVETKSLPIPNAPAGLAFRGAGSTTSAPVGPVK